ncbi:MAG TPA: HK97-gp10 family putative phage morphogenesis protein [Clostridia bacterium]
MPTDVSMEGFDEIIKKLEEMGKKVDRLPNKILPEAGKPILEAAKDKAPENTGKLKENLDMSKVKNKDGNKYIEIGITKADNSPIFYGKFIEFGTSKMPARPFLQPAYEEKKKETYEIIKEMLKKELEL